MPDSPSTDVARRKIPFSIDGKPYETDDLSQSAADLLRLAGLDPAMYDLGEVTKDGPGQAPFQGRRHRRDPQGCALRLDPPGSAVHVMDDCVQAFVEAATQLELSPTEDSGLIVCHFIPAVGVLAGTSVEVGVAVDELRLWPQAPPYWVHLPGDVNFAENGAIEASPKEGWLKHSRQDLELGQRAACCRLVQPYTSRPEGRDPMRHETSVAMTAATQQALEDILIRQDGQEDLCLATYRTSTGATRTSALITSVIAPRPDDRRVHGNVTVTADYVLRVLDIARADGCGLVVLHSHPGAHDWQQMSSADRDSEASYANLAREITGLPLVGMTLATGDSTWSARHWDVGVGRDVDCTHSMNVRVVGDQLTVSWNDTLVEPPPPTARQIRTISSWGDRCQRDLARRRVLVVGAGSVGLDVIVRLAASGLCSLTVMDFDTVEEHNLDRLIGALSRDVSLKRPKIHVARRLANAAATGDVPRFEFSDLSICEPDGLKLALDHDLIFSCVDRPWPRAVLNALAYTDLIPVIDGGIAIDTFDDGSMRSATWRTHVVRPGRPCMSCNRQLDLGQVIPDKQGVLDDAGYINHAGRSTTPHGQNVAPLSVSVSASLLAQYTSFSVALAGFGDPGPLQYVLSTHELKHRNYATRDHCPVESCESVGDHRTDLADHHPQAEHQRQIAASPGRRIRILRWIDDRAQALGGWLDRVRDAS